MGKKNYRESPREAVYTEHHANAKELEGRGLRHKEIIHLDAPKYLK